MNKRTREDYVINIVKRKKQAVCKLCSKLIDIGENASVINYTTFEIYLDVIGITHSECAEKFIEENISNLKN